MSQRHKVAIDFGTTNSVIAVWDDVSGTVRALPILDLSSRQPDGPLPLIPSLLYVQDGQVPQVALGQAVLDKGFHLRRDNRLFRNFKRGILTRSSEEPRLIDGVPWRDHDAGRHFVKGLLKALPYAVREIEILVLTAPVAAFEGYLVWLSEGVEDLLADNLRLVDESTAAALGYSVTEPGTLVLVFDFGGGSLDLSLVQLPESRAKTGGLLKYLRGKSASQHTARVISKAGLTLGGSDIDHWLLAEALKRFNLTSQDLGLDYGVLLTACETAKVGLSETEAVTLSFSLVQQDYELTLHRAELEALMEEKGFFSAVRRVINKVMHLAQRQGIFKEDIHHVLLIGGTSLIPSVQQVLKEYFSAQAVQIDKPFTAVAEGALQVAVGFGLDDYLAHSYGLRYLDSHTGEHRYDEVIPMGSRYPTKEPVEVMLGAAHQHQEAIEFVFGEIELDEVSRVELKYEGGQVVFVAQASLETQHIIPLNEVSAAKQRVHLDPPGEPGEARLRARFRVDEGRRLCLSVVDLEHDREIIEDVVLITLGEHSLEEVETDLNKTITGFEPRLVTERVRSTHRLSLRKLGTILNLLPPDAISLEAAVEALRSDEFYVRYQAADLLGRRGDRDARLVMEDFLTNGSPPQRASVAYHLYRFSWYVAEPLLRRALQDDDLRVRENAVYALCRVRNPGAYQMLLEVTPGGGDRLKLAAVWGLSRSPDPESLPVLEVTLQASDPEVRVQALEVIAATETPGAIPTVLRAMEDPDLEVKYAATLSWIELAGVDCFPELARAIQSTQGAVRGSILRGLFHATNYLFINIADSPAANQVLEALEAGLNDDLPDTRLAAVKPLAWMRDERASAILQAGFRREQDPALKSQMLYNIVSLMSPVAGELLHDALKDSRPDVYQAAEYLLSNIHLYNSAVHDGGE